MKIAIGSDHAGFALKEKLKDYLADNGNSVEDMGTHSLDSTDYPDYAYLVADAVQTGVVERGVLICGSGIGMSIAANRFSGVRAAQCTDPEHAILARAHNNANVVTVGAGLVDEKTAKQIMDTFFNTEFEGGRHTRRVDKLTR